MMDARLQLRIQRYGWDAAATYYDAGWHAQLRPAHDRLLHMAGLTARQQVIETACGTGLVTLRIAEQVGPDGKVFATDLSEAMLDNLRSRLTGPHFSNIELGRMAAERLDVPNGAFDAAICALGLMYTLDPAAAVAELVRVVKPGGTVAATVWGERRNCGWASVFAIVDARVASEVCPNFFATGVQGTLAKLFEIAGLEKVSEYRQLETLTRGDRDGARRADPEAFKKYYASTPHAPRGEHVWLHTHGQSKSGRRSRRWKAGILSHIRVLV